MGVYRGIVWGSRYVEGKQNGCKDEADEHRHGGKACEKYHKDCSTLILGLHWDYISILGLCWGNIGII